MPLRVESTYKVQFVQLSTQDEVNSLIYDVSLKSD